LANQIAAGEVVERPASVLKELMENAIDAGSKLIEVDISKGGKSLIRLTDNGCGISKDDLPLAVSRHATSKLTAIEDLNKVSSLGFRGEALASISSISRLSIISRFEKSDRAWSIDTGSDTDFTNYQAEVLPAALSIGTVIEVRDLFYNTPARRKFLRTDKTEFRYLEDVFKRIALSHFDVSFKLTHNKKLVKKLSVSASAEGKLFRLQKMFGENFIQQLQEVNKISQNLPDLGCLKLTGWISNSSYYRSYADQQFFYVNGRYVRDKLLNHALRQAYQESLKDDQHAAYILYLDIDPAYVDVNVHPTKHEIRFSQTRMVHDFIVSSLVSTLSPSIIGSYDTEAEAGAAESFYQQTIEKNSDSSKRIKQSPENQYLNKNYNSHSTIKDQIDGLSYLYKKTPADVFPENDVNKGEYADLEIVAFSNEQDIAIFNGKILTCFGSILLAQEDDILWVIDSLSAAKIINYEKLTIQVFNENTLNKQAENSIDCSAVKVKSHKLLIPENIVLTVPDCDLLLKWQQQLILLGVEFTLAGEDNLMLRALPVLPFDLENKQMLSSIVTLLNSIGIEPETDGRINRDIIQQLIDKISSSINLSQSIDKQQQLIMNYVSGSNYFPNDFSDKYKQTYKILTSFDINKIIRST